MPPEQASVRRLNWGCGSHIAPGWINTDIKKNEGVDLVADIRDGLPIATGALDYAVSIHALPELALPEQVPVLQELLRVLRPGGVLRLALPDLGKGIDAYLRGDRGYFKVEDTAASSMGGRFITHMLWYGYSRSLFTPDFAAELLTKAGFADVAERPFGKTGSEFAEIVELDNRVEESFFIEGTRPPAVDGDAYNPPMPQPSGVKILEVVHSTPNDLLRGHFRIEDSEEGLKLIGWALGMESPVSQVEIVAGDSTVARAPVAIERPDIAEKFPQAAEAKTAGFQMVIAPSGKGESLLKIEAALENGERAPIGEVHVVSNQPTRRARRGLFGRMR
ncbi:MAG TPA: methyltransferase domain-containing protein [Solirubrobacterales bacterium]|nr:methyltransferase domain-containing protein [Solirubrobacterales bacterium]